jgi:hypothetical protein
VEDNFCPNVTYQYFLRKKLKIQIFRMKKYAILFIVILVSINTVFSQLNQGRSFESWSNSLKFDQFNEDHIIVFGSSDFETWTNSKGFIHFFDEALSSPINIPEMESPVILSEKPDTFKNSEVYYSAKEAQFSSEDNSIFVSSKINIYPNPATDKINVNISLNSYSDIEITLFNSIGNIVYNTLVKDKKQIFKTIDVENINKGIYFLEIKTDRNKTIKKIIIK